MTQISIKQTKKVISIHWNFYCNDNSENYCL